MAVRPVRASDHRNGEAERGSLRCFCRGEVGYAEAAPPWISRRVHYLLSIVLLQYALGELSPAAGRLSSGEAGWLQVQAMLRLRPCDRLGWSSSLDHLSGWPSGQTALKTAVDEVSADWTLCRVLA